MVERGHIAGNGVVRLIRGSMRWLWVAAALVVGCERGLRAPTPDTPAAEVTRATLAPGGPPGEEAPRLTADSTELARIGPRNPPPPVPYVVRDMCPAEGCQFGEWLACGTYNVRAAERTDAPTVFTLQHGELFTALTGNLHVERPGMIVFRDMVRVRDGRDTITRVFTPADTLFTLYYEGEGFGKWYLHGREESAAWFFPYDRDSVSHDQKIHRVRKHRTVWWVRVRNAQGEEGWLRESGARGGIVGIAPQYETYPLACPDASGQ
jgi:hypothetical protein